MSWADCCGCGKKGGDEVLSGSGEKVEGSPFEATAKTWADIYVPQNNEATMAKLAEAGGTDSLVRQYGTNVTTGIGGTAEDLRARIMQFGENRYPEPPFDSWWSLFFECFKDIILLILIAAAIVSLIVGIIEHGGETGWIDGVAILIAVVIVATVTASNDYNKQLQFRKLSKESAGMVEIRVIRGGKEVAVKVAEIVVGDIIMVDTGCKLPADGLLLRGTDMKCNESALTGESDEVPKDPINHPFLLAGTNVTSGTGAYIATAVGIRSLQGQIMKDTAAEAEDTPLQQKLDGLATKIGYVGMVAAVATFIAMMIIKATGGGTSQSATWASWTIAAFIYAITIVVVAIPEGLPLAVTISLAYSTGKMLQDKNLIRHLDACETMGNATDICTDKTGTLTENQMTVVESWLGGSNYIFSTSLQNVQVTNPGALPPVLRDLLRDQLALNSTAAIVYKEENGVRKEEVKGSKTEGAGIKLVNGMGNGTDYQAIRDTYAREFRIIKQFAFSSERKMMSTIVELPDGRVRVFTTGGSDMVLSRCVSQSRLTADGSSFNNTPLGEADTSDIIRNVIEPMARQSLRTIAIAYRDFPNRAMLPRAVEELPEQDLKLYGILGIKDPLRKGVTEAVDIAARAGVRVRMVTGDNKITASAIAKECHILRNENDIVMEGPVFRTMTPAQLDMILPRLAVLARSSPKDKMILVRRLNGNLPSNEKEWKEDHPDGDWETQRDILLPGYYDEWKRARQHVSGNVARGVVGVTGDGTNDAPALKSSDVGLAMGIAGTEVAKEACDIIITDDNFASIVNSILWGRSVYDNVRSFLQFQLTVNIVALLLTFIAAVMQEDPPLNPVMMLWVNLIMDTMGALALATQTPSKELLDRKPFAASAFLVSPKMWRHLGVQSLFQLITLLVLLKVGPSSFGVTLEYLNTHGTFISNDFYPGSDDVTYYTNTFIFNTFVFSQIWNEFNARSLDDRWNVFRGLGSDLTFIAIIIISGGVQALLVQFGGNFVHTTGLTGIHWLYSILISLITFPLGILMRMIPVNDKPSDYAEFYMDFFAKQMAVELERNKDSHPAFAKGAKGAPTLDAHAHVHGMPGSGVEMTPAKEASKRNLTGAPVGVSIRGSHLSDGPIAAPLSPTNELGMIQGLSTGLAASPTGEGGFSSNKFGTSSSSGNSSAAPTGASTATPSLVELQGVTVDPSSGAGALPAAGSSSVPQPPSPAMGGSDESRPLVN